MTDKALSILTDTVVVTPVTDITVHPRNPRVNDLDPIRESIRTNGFFGTLVVQQSSGHVLVGNHRLLAAVEEGFSEVPVMFVDVDDEAATRIMLADNRLAERAVNDLEGLVTILRGLDATPAGLGGTGYEDGDLARLLADMDKRDRNMNTGSSGPIAPVTDPYVKAGDLWTVGPHRVLCGDATDPAHVDQLLDGASPNLMVTDPPYGVNYDPDWRAREAEKGNLAYAARRTGKVDNDDRADWSEAFSLHPGDVIYTWAPPGPQTSDFIQALATAGFDVRTGLIWAKRHFPIGRGHYHIRHEPCWYAVRHNKPANWIGDRKQTTIWDDITLDTNADGGHSTQKPVECMARPIRNHEGDVYDPFIGSGTTLIAADNLGRTGYAMDISPSYVQVTIERLATHTGHEPKRQHP